MRSGISKAVIRRLPRYYRYLGELQENGTERISSAELSALMDVTASQIRQDLNHFGGFGQQGYGYNVATLRSEIARILGIDRTHKMIIAGVGSFGQTLAKYFAEGGRAGFVLIGLFDNDPALEGTVVAGLPVRMMRDLPAFAADEKPEIAALTVPKSAVAEAADAMAGAGIRAIWNFAHADLHVPDGVAVENVHLLDSLMTLSYGIAEGGPEEERE